VKEKNLLRQALNEMKRMKAGELHYYDEAFTYTNVSPTIFQYNNLVMPSIGTGINSSAAGRITMRNIEMNVTVQNVSTAQPAAVRVLLFQAKGLNAGLGQANILQSISTGPIAVTSAHAYNDQNVDVVHLADYHFDTDPQWNAQQTKFANHKCKIRETKYSTAESAWATGIPGVLICNTSIVSSGLSVTVYTRIWFYDGA
jgi:hypothetical protein